MTFWPEIFNRIKMRWLLLILCGLISAYGQASELKSLLPPVRLAVVNSFGSNLSVRYFNDTVNAIARAVAPRRLVVQFYDQEVFLQAAQVKGFDLAIASSGLTALMTDASSASALLTVINSRTPDPNQANGGVIVVRSDRDDINCLADLKGKTVAVSSTKAFAGFLAVMGEIQSEGLNPNRLFKSVTATHKPMTELVKQVVNEKKDENFYCKHSTRLYPGWILSAQPTLESKTLRKIMEALLQLPPGKEEGSYWTVATDYDQMNLLLQRMEVRYLEDRTIGWMLNYYRWYFIVGCGALLLIILNWAYLAFAVRRKTEQLRKKVEENREYERENRKITERIEALEKAKSIGIISAMVAHELKQPLGAINNYSEAILRQLKRGKKPAEEILTEAFSEIKSESQRASDIVEFVRNIGRKEPRERKCFDLEAAVSRTIRLMKRLGRLNSKCTLSGAKNVLVFADPLNVDLVLMNLLKNAEEAVRNQSNAEIKVEIKNAGADALVIIDDNGPKMSDEQFASLRNLGQSSKKDGLGLGLAIVRELLEANGGSLKLVRIPAGGLRCIASLPIALEDKNGPG
ncbi:MAG: sensor histidine kinase [Parasutterella excrementihominis]|jgi:two-component system sensor histidine kinase TtrS|nr:sensor histidine kinase [Parasutterella excrementihominis]